MKTCKTYIEIYENERAQHWFDSPVSLDELTELLAINEMIQQAQDLVDELDD